MRKAWVLTLVDQLSAVNFTFLNDYSCEAFLQAYSNHGNQFRFPSLVTADSGSQIKAAARCVTRSMSVKEGDKGSPEEENGSSWDRMLATTMRRFKDTKFMIVPTEGQSHNGISEGNIRIVKQLMRSHQRLLKGQCSSP